MQHLIQGEGSLITIGAEITKAGCQSVFLITGKHFLQEHDLDFLKGLNVHHYIKDGNNVEETEMKLAVDIFHKNNAEVVLAVGGGSVIDIAKTIINKCIELSAIIPLFIVAPSTAGSGSEATHFAVVYRNKKKESLVHPALLPKIVVLDPQLTYSLPAWQTAVSGMDALSQAIESYWNRNATAESKQYATKAILLWKESFLSAVKENNKTARAKMLEAAHLAGKAINITRTTGPHALSYYLTANFNVAHGQAVSLFLPAFFLYNQPDKELCSLLGVNDADEAADWIRRTMKDTRLATTLQELGINKEVILDELLNEVNEERFANNPSVFDREKLIRLLEEQL
jgi:alcohol dehydrogenase class IV